MPESEHKEAAVICLASGSAQRQQLLMQIGITFRVCAPDIDESRRCDELLSDYVRRLALQKARAVAARVGGSLPVLAADTALEHAGEVLTKARDRVEAERLLTRLSGSTHTVRSGVALLADGAEWSTVVATSVQFMALSRQQILAYIDTGEWFGKAGAYGIQGIGAVMIQSIQGSYSNVVGLPLHEASELLRQAGIEVFSMNRMTTCVEND